MKADELWLYNGGGSEVLAFWGVEGRVEGMRSGSSLWAQEIRSSLSTGLLYDPEVIVQLHSKDPF